MFLRHACAIPDSDSDTVILTGGMDNPKIVSLYDEEGWIRDLPSLNEKRLLHGCANFNSDSKMVYI